MIIKIIKQYSFTIKRNNCKQTHKFVENVQIANTPSHQSDFWQLTRVQGKHKRNAKANQCPQSIAKLIRTYLVNNWYEAKKYLKKKILCCSGLAFGDLVIAPSRPSKIVVLVSFAHVISNIFHGLSVSSVALGRHVSWPPFASKAFCLPGLGWVGVCLFSLYFSFSFR